MEIVVGDAKQDKVPIGHAAASPHCHKEIAWRDHHHQVHLVLMDHVIVWQSPQKMK